MAERGRPRKYRNDAAKQKAYRARKKWKKQRSQRFEALRKSPMGRNRDVLYPGDTCVLCGLTVIWTNQDMRAWSLKYAKYRYIEPVRYEGWIQTSDKWLVCPDCAAGHCEQPIARDPVTKIAFGDYDEYIKRTT